MRTIKTIVQLIERAERQTENFIIGEAVIKKRHDYNGNKFLEPKECYRVEVDSANNIYTLYHWKTKTAQVYKGKNITKVLYTYGQSRSDADSVNTFLNYLGANFTPFSYSDKNGFYQ